MKLADIKPNPYQPREIFDEEKLEELADSIKEHGANTLRLLSLPDKVQKLVENGTLTAGQARPLITVDPKDIDKLVDKVVKENLSARRVEKLVQDYKNPPIKNTPVISEVAQEHQKQLQHYLQTRVKIDGTKITINYVDENDLERIVEAICSKE